MFLIVPGPYIPSAVLTLLSLLFLLLLLLLPLGSVSSLLSRVFPIELWDSLSTYVHLGIACLASWASDWLGALWASLSGSQSSMTPCKTQCDWSLLVTT